MQNIISFSISCIIFAICFLVLTALSYFFITTVLTPVYFGAIGGLTAVSAPKVRSINGKYICVWIWSKKSINPNIVNRINNRFQK